VPHARNIHRRHGEEPKISLAPAVYLEEYKVEAMTVRYLYGTDITTRNEAERAVISQ